jgi:hypothetical protein
MATEYIGKMFEGQMHGMGKLIYENDEFYNGDFVRGKRHGQGEYVYADGSTFKGSWTDDKICGEVFYIYTYIYRCIDLLLLSGLGLMTRFVER